MDDLEFRRRAYAEPDCQDTEFLEHKNLSSENTSLVEELQLLNKSLKQAVQIEPPEDLAERIKLNQSLGQYQSTRRRWRLWSIASSVLVVFAVVFNYAPLDQGVTDQPLADNVLSHIYHELDHLYEQQNRSLSQVNNLLSAFGANISRNIGQVNYLGSCDIANKKGVHLVVQGSIGPITVMLLPEISVPEQMLFNDKRFKGIIMPSGRGSIAVVGEKGESLKLMQNKLTQQLHWI